MLFFVSSGTSANWNETESVLNINSNEAAHNYLLNKSEELEYLMGDYLSNFSTNINSWETGLRDLLYERT